MEADPFDKLSVTKLDPDAAIRRSYLAKRGVRGACEITLVLPLSSPMPASADLSRALVAAFAETGIQLLLGGTVKALEPGRKTAVFDDGTEVPYALYLGVPKHQVPQPVLASGMAENGWVPITPAGGCAGRYQLGTPSRVIKAENADN